MSWGQLVPVLTDNLTKPSEYAYSSVLWIIGQYRYQLSPWHRSWVASLMHCVFPLLPSRDALSSPSKKISFTVFTRNPNPKPWHYEDDILFILSTVWSAESSAELEWLRETWWLSWFQDEPSLIITINDTNTSDLPFIITIGDTSKRQPNMLHSDNHINHQGW